MKTIILQAESPEGLKTVLDLWIKPVFDGKEKDTGASDQEDELYKKWENEKFQNHFREWCDDDDSENDNYLSPVIHNVQQFAFQIVTPNTFRPDQPKIEMKYQLLIIYS